MANLIYTADDLNTVVMSAPNANVVTRPFIATLVTMLAQTGGVGLTIGDQILLAPIPGNAMLFDYQVRIPELDTSTAVTYDLGDNVVLSGAVNILSGTSAQTTQTTAGGTFTLTAAASTASFVATNGFLSVGGIPVAYASLSGSTFVSCNALVANATIPAGTLIQQAANQAVYQAVAANQSASAVTLLPYGSVSNATWVTTTAKPGALPARYAAPFNTNFPANLTNAAFTVPAQIGQRYFTLTIHASPTTYNAPSVPITGHISYFMTGYAV